MFANSFLIFIAIKGAEFAQLVSVYGQRKSCIAYEGDRYNLSWKYETFLALSFFSVSFTEGDRKEGKEKKKPCAYLMVSIQQLFDF